MIYVILGMHRSGTSLTSSILQDFGINMGTNLLSSNSPSASNILGHYEDLDFLSINREFLTKHGRSWDNPYLLNPEPNEIVEFKSKISNIILYKQGNWGFKDPRTILFINYYYEILKEHKCCYIFTDRSTDDIVSSLSTRQPKSNVDFYKLTEYYKKELNIFKDFLKSNGIEQLTVKYEAMIEEPLESCSLLAQFISHTSNIKIPKEKIKNATKKIFERKKLEKVKKRIRTFKLIKMMLNPVNYYKEIMRLIKSWFIKLFL